MPPTLFPGDRGPARENADYSGPPTRAGDLPLLYVLFALHLALIIILPLGALSLGPLVGRLQAAGRLSLPQLLGFGIAWLIVEVGFIWRAQRVWARIVAVQARRPR